jgi:hypothetical protein
MSILRFLGTPAALAAFLLLGTERGRAITKKAAREVVKGGLVASDKCKELAVKAKDKSSGLVGQVKDSAAELVAEVRAEQKQAKAISSKE